MWPGSAPDGNSLLFASYLGGSGGTFAFPEAAQAIALDSWGNAYVAGVTGSTDFPALHAAQSSRTGATDAFVAKVSAAGTLAYSTYIGGSGAEVANAIAVDPTGVAYAAGYTFSTDLPVINPLQGANGGDCDAFLARIGASGTLEYLSYLGGNGSDTATAVALSPAGSVYVAGWTLSTNFPLRNPVQAVDAGNYAAFVTRLDFGSLPVAVGVTPNSGSGDSQSFRFQFADSGGAAGLTGASALFNSTASVVNACAVQFDPKTNALSLLTDLGQPPPAPIAPGSGSQQNSHCTLNGTASTVSMAGTVLTLTLSIAFRPEVAGDQNIYMQAANANASTGWQLSGTWTTPPIANATPADAGSLAAYLSSTTFIDFSRLTDFDWATQGPRYSSIGDEKLSVSFSSGMSKWTFPPNYGIWSVWPASQRLDDSAPAQLLTPLNPVFDPNATDGSPQNAWPFLPAVTMTLSSPARVFGFEAMGEVAESKRTTAVFHTTSSDTLTIASDATSLGHSRIFAAAGAGAGLITRVDLFTDDVDVNVGFFRYALPDSTGEETVPPGYSSLASITAPTNGSTLSGATAVFQWSAGSGVSEYWLYLSRVAPGGKDLYSASQGLSASKTVSGLPTDGATVYARLWSKFAAGWQYADFTYKAAKTASLSAPPAASAAPAAIIKPANGSSLPGSTVLFQWSPAAGVSEYWLYLSSASPGAADLFSGSMGLEISKTLKNLPTAGGLIYARLWSKVNAAWHSADFTYKAATHP